jgi:hypothetical protein
VLAVLRMRRRRAAAASALTMIALAGCDSGGDATLLATGEPCERGAECISGLCATTVSGGACALGCDDEDGCSDGSSCRIVEVADDGLSLTAGQAWVVARSPLLHELVVS